MTYMLRRLEVRDLELLTAIVDEGSLTRAATRLHVTQPALSHQLKDVEDQLGTALFFRRKKRLLLTPAGERLVESARRILQDLTRAQEEAVRISTEFSGLLRIATQCYTCYHWLPAKIRKFSGKHPQVEIQIIAEATLNPFQYLLNKRLDLAIVHTPIRNRNLVYIPLFKDELVVVVRPDHEFAKRAFIALEELENEHLLHAIPKDQNIFFQQVLSQAGVVPRKTSYIHLTEALIELVKAGVGIAVMANWASRPHVAAGGVKAVRLTANGIYRGWSAAILRGESKTPHMEHFLSLISTAPR